MTFQKTKLAMLLLPLMAGVVAGCNGDNNSSTGPGPEPTNPVVDAVELGGPVTDTVSVAVPVPGDLPSEVMAEAPENTAIVQLLVSSPSPSPAARSAEDLAPYANYSLHIWNNDECSSADASLLRDWDDQGNTPAGADANGPYWELPLVADDCLNFIMRDGDNNKVTPNDMKLVFADHTDRMVALISGGTEIFSDRGAAYAAGFSGGVTGASAHLIDAETLVFPDAAGAEKAYLFYAREGGVAPVDGSFGGISIELEPVELTDAQKAKYPHLDHTTAYKLPVLEETANLDKLLKGELVAVAADAEGTLVAATQVQFAGALDALYGDAAKNERLGAIVGDGETTFKLWAPTAKSVYVKLYSADKTQSGNRLAMDYDASTGIWSTSSDRAVEGTYYRYEVNVFHPATRQMYDYEVTDPYSLSLSTNSEYSQVVNLADASLKPSGWDEHAVPPQASAISIYESHVRDFSALDESTTPEFRGKYKAFTQEDSVPVKHIKALQEAGLTHFHLLPVFDIATVDEVSANRVDLTDTVAKLCELNPDAYTCTLGAEPTATLQEVMASAADAPLVTVNDNERDIRELITSDIRMLDSFNWGYDPFHFGAIEGSYATDPEGTARIVEFREMVQALHSYGFRVVMDVVYNHTNAAGPDSDKSVLDKVVPWYYQRLSASTGAVENSTCCSNSATEHTMMAKLMKDTLVIFARDYKIDGFRFDLMGHQPLDAMTDALKLVQTVDSDTYFYGEGWNFGEVQNDARFKQATQLNLGGTGIGSFSDRMRDVVRGGSPFDSQDGIRRAQGLANGLHFDKNEVSELVADSDTLATLLQYKDIARVELAGNLADFVLQNAEGRTVRGSDVDYNGQPAGYTESAHELISYVSKHDNQTFWDINQYKLPTAMSPDDRVRAQNFGLAFPLLGQGMPFLHMGSDIARSKSMERDSYDSGDNYNRVDFTMTNNNWNVGLPSFEKDGNDGNYPLIKEVIANENTVLSQEQIQQANAVFNEYLAIRKGSPLFNLAKKEVIMDRIDFINTGEDQNPALIVMTINDGKSPYDHLSREDLDPSVDGMVLVFNSSNEAQTFDVGVAGLTLHPVQQASADALIASSSVEGTSVTVPGYTAAVFVLPQDGAQGDGLDVAAKEFYDPEYPPYGNDLLYLRGSVASWDPVTEMTFLYDGQYQTSLALTAGSYEFKVADVDWGDSTGINFGYGELDVSGSPIELTDNGGNIAFTVAEDGVYIFDLNAKDKEAKTVRVWKVVSEKPAGDTTIYIRGDMNEWGTTDAFTYVDSGIYTADLTLDAGTYGFKIASDDWSTINRGAGPIELEADQRTVSLSNNGANMSLTIDTAGDYTFTLNSIVWTLELDTK